eukprot:gene10044-13502_t
MFSFCRSINHNVRKLLIPVGFGTVSLAIYQGVKVRVAYKNAPQLEAPKGPHNGLELWVDKLKYLKDDVVERVKENEPQILWKKAMAKIRETLVSKDKLKEDKIDNRIIYETGSECGKTSRSNKKFRLLIVGDSLVAGVGCDGAKSSPVLPKVLATVLSYVLKADIEWTSAGIIGASVRQLHTELLPDLTENFLNPIKSSPIIQSNLTVTVEEEKSELIVVVICGLNDLRLMFDNFPNCRGIHTFKTELTNFVDEIKQSATNSNQVCRVYLPALPILSLHSDPTFSLRVQPLNFILSTIFWFWDNQKYNVAVDDLMGSTTYINQPTNMSEYATPGLGNVCSDGIHPSSQGYTWWAIHIAESILASIESSQQQSLPHNKLN